jgi:very-short-patch-repair endonuclease
MLLNNLKKIKPGKTKTFICEDISYLLSEFQLLQAENFKNKFIVTHSIKKIPKEKNLINDFVYSLASAVYETWPLWYNKKTFFKNTIDSSPEKIVEDFYIEKKSDLKNLSKAWLKKSIKCCQQKEIPFLNNFPNKIQSAQLALTLNPQDLIFTIYVEDYFNESDKLMGLARAAEWFSKETNGSVALLLPEKFNSFKELDSILYDSIFIPNENRINYPARKFPGESKYNIWPLEGKPHPLSPGEKKLADFLSKEDELKGLFQFNKKITTVRNTNYFVDLLWPEGKLVIEIDGYKYHKNRHAFQVDRTRDYELSISNYMVLRLTHDEVMHDINGAVIKIRNVIDFCLKNRNIKE